MNNKLPENIEEKFIEALMKVLEEKFEVNIDYKIKEVK